MSASAAKTVAIIGGGPTGLAAAAHALERGHRADRAGAGRSGRPCGARNGATCACSRPGATTSTRRPKRLLLEAGLEQPRSRSLSDGRRAGRRTTSSRWRRARGSPQHIQTDARVISIARAGFDKVKTAGREKAPFEIRYRNGKGPIDAARRRGDRCLRHLGHAQSRRRQRARSHRRGRARASASPTACPTCSVPSAPRYAGKIGRRAGRRAFGRSAPSSIWRASRRRSPRTADRLAPARRQPGEVVRRRRQRQAGRARRARLACSPARARGGVRVETGFRADAHRRAAASKLRLGAGSACCGRHVEADELIVATGFRPDLSFLRELRIALDPALECPPDPGAADRPQPAQLRHRAPARRARAGAAGARLLLRRHEVLRARADVPDDDRLRAGALDRGRHRRRPGGGRARRAGAAGDRGVQPPAHRRSAESAGLLRRAGTVPRPTPAASRMPMPRRPAPRAAAAV